MQASPSRTSSNFDNIAQSIDLDSSGDTVVHDLRLERLNEFARIDSVEDVPGDQGSAGGDVPPPGSRWGSTRTETRHRHNQVDA